MNIRTKIGYQALLFLFGTLFLLFLLAESAQAAKFYKWVDKEGTVHYTQTPPPADQVDDKMVSIKQSKSASVPVTRKGDYDYCGTNRMPGPYDDAKAILNGLDQREEQWRSSLRQKEKSLNDALKEESRYRDQRLKYNSSSSTRNDSYHRERRERLVKEIKDLRCSLTWVDKQRNYFKKSSKEYAGEYKSAERIYQAALEKAIQECGYKPSNFDDRNYEVNKSTWDKCMRKHNGTISSRKRKMEDAKQVYQQLH